MNPWVILGFVLALMAAVSGGYYKGDESGRAFVQQQWDKEKADQYAEYAKGQEAARQREQSMQATADQLRKEKDREIREISARATALSNSLRDRSERPTEGNSLPGSSGACRGASGAQLARGDGEFLAGYAADAAKLQTALNQCIKQYEAVRNK
jgi:hypothetical protein